MLAGPALMNTCLVFCLCALLCETISFCVPAWLIVVFESNILNLRRSYAVWYMQECLVETQAVFFRTESCVTSPYAEKLKSKHRHLYHPKFNYAFTSSEVIRWEVEATVGLLCIIVASILIFILRRNNLRALSETYPRLHEPSPISFYLPPIFTTVSGSLYGASIFQLTEAHIPKVQSVAHEVPYGAVLGALGAFLALLTSVNFLLMFLKRRIVNEDRVEDNVDQSGQGMPMMET